MMMAAVWSIGAWCCKVAAGAVTAGAVGWNTVCAIGGVGGAGVPFGVTVVVVG